MAIPSAHITAMAESSRMRHFEAIHSTAADEQMANTAAESMGFMPRK